MSKTHCTEVEAKALTLPCPTCNVSDGSWCRTIRARGPKRVRGATYLTASLHMPRIRSARGWLAIEQVSKEQA